MFAVLLAALALCPLLAACTPGGPVFTAASIANSAANIAGYYSPDSFISIYGENLAYVTKAIGPGDLNGGQLPFSLTGTNVTVLMNGSPVDVFYVSPNQVNVLIPPFLIAGPATVELENWGLFECTPVTITLTATAPALFQSDAATALATHGNGPVVTPAAPAQPGEIVILYATGLGPTIPPAIPNEVPETAAPIAGLSQFQVLLNGAAIDPRLVLYAGVAPGFAGLFQINVRLPADAPPNPQIQIAIGSQISPAGVVLPLQ